MTNALVQLLRGTEVMYRGELYEIVQFEVSFGPKSGDRLWRVARTKDGAQRSLWEDEFEVVKQPHEQVKIECKRCLYKKHCGGFRTREGRCPEWVMNELRDGKDGRGFSQEAKHG